MDGGRSRNESPVSSIQIYGIIHKLTVSAQTAFFENVKAMTTLLQDMCNPFQDESSELLLDTKNIAEPSLAQLVSAHHQRGLQQFEVFLGGRHNEE